MFEVKKNKTLIRGLHEIVANSLSLLNDGSNDILYTGTNKFGNRLLGTIVLENRQEQYLRYFHILITEEVFLSFLNRKKTLRAILEESESFFVVDKNFNDEISDYNIVSINDIPEQFIPLQNSYCPTFVYEATFDYVFSLKGGLSDLHMAEPETVNNMNSKFSSFLKQSFDFLNDLNIGGHVYSFPSQTGSFELNFKIELQEDNGLFKISNNDISEFLVKLYNYIFNKLPQHEEKSLKVENIESDDFKKLEKNFSDLFSNRFAEHKGSEQRVIDLITYSIEPFKDIQYEGFDNIEVMNKNTNGDRIPIAIVKKDFYDIVSSKLFSPEEINKEDEIIVDKEPKNYEISVYWFNSESGKGGAHVRDNQIQYKTPLHLKGRANYRNTIFTRNANDDEDVFITVSGIATRRNGRIELIEYTYY
ncbi:MAG TPA: hypothetical protein VKR53_00955 [Puia sp.]|nr:hypothetical protein [Puia sp.]